MNRARLFTKLLTVLGSTKHCFHTWKRKEDVKKNDEFRLGENQGVVTVKRVGYLTRRAINLTFRRLDDVVGGWKVTVNEGTDYVPSEIAGMPDMEFITSESYTADIAMAKAVIKYLIANDPLNLFWMEDALKEHRQAFDKQQRAYREKVDRLLVDDAKKNNDRDADGA